MWSAGHHSVEKLKCKGVIKFVFGHKGTHANLSSAAVTRLWVDSHNFPQLTAGQILSVGGQRSQSHEYPQTSKENNFVMHVSLAQEMGRMGLNQLLKLNKRKEQMHSLLGELSL